MKSNGIGISCVQEIRKFSSEHFTTPEGFLCIFSGANCAKEKTSDSGVGFIIAPEVRPSVVGFCQLSDRLCSLRLRVEGGKILRKLRKVEEPTKRDEISSTSCLHYGAQSL